MSLYGGISFKGQAKPPAAAAASAPAPAADSAASVAPAAPSLPPAAAQTQGQGQDAPDKPKRNGACPHPFPRPRVGERAQKLTVSLPPPAATWSAALRFAPTARKRPNALAGSTAKPSASAIALKSAFGAAADDDDDDDGDARDRGGPGTTGNHKRGADHPPAYRIPTVGKAALTAAPEKAPPVNKWSAVSRPVEEIKPFASTSTAPSRLASPADAASQTKAGGKPRTRTRRVIANPPAMTLEDEPLAASTAGGTDVNGFAASAAGQKLAAQQNKRRGNKKKKRGGAAGEGGPHEDPALAFADVPYDPARPCDYVRGDGPLRGPGDASPLLPERRTPSSDSRSQEELVPPLPPPI